MCVCERQGEKERKKERKRKRKRERERERLRYVKCGIPLVTSHTCSLLVYWGTLCKLAKVHFSLSCVRMSVCVCVERE